MLKVINVSKSFEEKQVLRGASMEIREGEIVGLFGTSGCGKSTLARIICSLETADSGSVEYSGAPLSIQMVYQQPFSVLDPVQKIRNGFKELISYHKMPFEGDIDTYLDALAEDVELDRDILNHLPHQISGGEAQRIAIIKSLLFRPKLLILDEASSMLDVSTQANILGYIKAKMNASGGSILMVSHDGALIDFYCNRVYTVENKSLKEK